MDWYYVEQSKSVGPINDEELGRLAASGKVQAETLVWREGMPNWIPYRDVAPAASPSLAAPTGGTAATTSPAVASTDQVVCMECRRTVPREETIQYGASYVCAACKPVFVQRLREGAEAPGTMTYGGFWIRLAAKLIDILLFVILSVPFIIWAVMSAVKRGMGQPPTFVQFGLQIGTQLAFMLVSVAYTTFFHGKYGATLGKMACGLKVVTPEGGKVSYARALGRGFAELVSGWICDIGYIIAAFDGQKRSLHDHIASTRVIRVR